MRIIFLFLFICSIQYAKAQNSTLKDLFPLKLFFANDEPNPRSTNSSTELNYTKTYQSYAVKFEQYQGEGAMFEHLLNGDIIPNYEKIDAVKTILIDSLKTGNRIVLNVKGFASPLHNNTYNVKISERRINSFVNELETNSELKNYILNKQLIIDKLPFGEYTAHEQVNENLDSTHLSVYHMQASYERRIEVELSSIGSNKNPILFSNSNFLDAGNISKGSIVNISFNIENIGEEDLIVEKTMVSCGCSTANLDTTSLPAKSSTDINVSVNTSDLPLGKQSKSITIFYNNGYSKRFVILLDVK